MRSVSCGENSLEQENASLNKKSVQEVSKRKQTEISGRYPKTDVRYWDRTIFKPKYTKDGRLGQVKHWAVKIQHLGRRETFSLVKANRTEASARAKEIYLTLKSDGWDAALAKFKPEAAPKAVSTVGDFLSEVQAKA